MDSTQRTCPECSNQLHEGQQKFRDGFYLVKYCKHCGYREERSEK